MLVCAEGEAATAKRDNKSRELQSTERVKDGPAVQVGEVDGERSSCAKWSAVLRQECVLRQEM